MKKNIIVFTVFCSVIVLSTGVFYGLPKARISQVKVHPLKNNGTHELPAKNAAIIKYIEGHGESIAPRYNEVVCTEFVIAVLQHFTPLTAKMKKEIRIITTEDLETLVTNDADVIKGVQVALLNGGVGTIIDAKDACAGDLVQFWNTSMWGPYGHCGFVVEAKVGVELVMYSSHPMTGGFGKQSFSWPDKVYFARLK